MKVLDKKEREALKKKQLRNNIIYVIFAAIVLYICLFILLNGGGYKRDESLNVHYDLYHDLIPDPIQHSISSETFTINVRGVDVNFTKLASYDITGKVEAIQDYNTNPIANMLSFKGTNIIDYISPVDFTLSWGKIALMENSNHIWSDQYYLNRDRVVTTFYDNELIDKYGKDYINSHFSNNHIITMDRGIRNELSKVKITDIIRMQGYLVNVECSNGVRWGPSSMSRTDDGLHSCEIFYIEKFIKMK